MNLKCGYFTVGGIMCGSLVGIFVGALAVNVWPTPARHACGPRKARKKVLSLTTPLRADARALMQPPGWARVSSPGKCRERKERFCEKRRLGKGKE